MQRGNFSFPLSYQPDDWSIRHLLGFCRIQLFLDLKGKKKKLSVVEKSMHLSLTQIYHVAGIDARVMPRLLTLSLSPFAREI